MIDISNKDGYIVCKECKESKARRLFYKSYHEKDAETGVHPYCKACLTRLYKNRNGIPDTNRFKRSVLEMRLDRPYIEDLWISAMGENSDNPIGPYMKNIALKHNRDLTWEDSIFESEMFDSAPGAEDDLYDVELGARPVSRQTIQFWGRKGWERDDYHDLDALYSEMININRPESPQEKDYIKKIVKLSVKFDRAVDDGDGAKAKHFGDLYSKFMMDSKLRTSDMTDADKSGGIKRFCDIFAETEKEDFIPPWEEYAKINGAKQDFVDKTIMFILNFYLKLSKMKRLIVPPKDTPKLEEHEIDENTNLEYLEQFESAGDLNYDEL